MAGSLSRPIFGSLNKLTRFSARRVRPVRGCCFSLTESFGFNFSTPPPSWPSGQPQSESGCGRLSLSFLNLTSLACQLLLELFSLL